MGLLGGEVSAGADHHRIYARRAVSTVMKAPKAYVTVIGSILDIYVVLICSASSRRNDLTHSGPESQNWARLTTMPGSCDAAVCYLEPICVDVVD